MTTTKTKAAAVALASLLGLAALSGCAKNDQPVPTASNTEMVVEETEETAEPSPMEAFASGTGYNYFFEVDEAVTGDTVLARLVRIKYAEGGDYIDVPEADQEQVTIRLGPYAAPREGECGFQESKDYLQKFMDENGPSQAAMDSREDQGKLQRFMVHQPNRKSLPTTDDSGTYLVHRFWNVDEQLAIQDPVLAGYLRTSQLGPEAYASVERAAADYGGMGLWQTCWAGDDPRQPLR